MQLDLFEHSRDVILRNAVVEALRRYDAAAAEVAIAALATHHAADPWLPAMAVLCGWLRRMPLAAALAPADGATAVKDAEAAVDPAARRVFGGDWAAWLAPLWCDLARSLAGLAFDPQNAQVHAVPCWLRGGDWRAAVAGVEAIPSWRRQPAPLAWLIEARAHLDGAARTWPLAAELAWMAPARARALLPRLPIAQLGEWARRFEREFDGSDASDGFAWFPAWVLIEEGRLAEALRLAEPGSHAPPERCARLIMNLLALERQGRHTELVEGRRQLRHAHGGLFDLYLRRR